MAARCAWLFGAARVIVFDLLDYGLEFVKNYAPAEVYNFKEVDDVVVFMKKTTDGLGADVAIDAVGGDAKGNFLHTLFGTKLKLEAGSAIPLHWAINSVKKGGIVSIVGVYGPTGNMVPIGNVVNKGLTVRANQASVKRLLPRLIEHVRLGHINPKPMITHRLRLEDVADAYHMFAAKLDGCIKPVLIRMQDKEKWHNAIVETSRIPGWGVDANPDNDPTDPTRDQSSESNLKTTWSPPEMQQTKVEILQSIEYIRRPAVTGTSTPPSGISGIIRRMAFTYSESHWAHWLMLIGADRITWSKVSCTISAAGRSQTSRARWACVRNGATTSSGL